MMKNPFRRHTRMLGFDDPPKRTRSVITTPYNRKILPSYTGTVTPPLDALTPPSPKRPIKAGVW